MKIQHREIIDKPEQNNMTDMEIEMPLKKTKRKILE